MYGERCGLRDTSPRRASEIWLARTSRFVESTLPSSQPAIPPRCQILIEPTARHGQQCRTRTLNRPAYFAKCTEEPELNSFTNSPRVVVSIRRQCRRPLFSEGLHDRREQVGLLELPLEGQQLRLAPGVQPQAILDDPRIEALMATLIMAATKVTGLPDGLASRIWRKLWTSANSCHAASGWPSSR